MRPGLCLPGNILKIHTINVKMGLSASLGRARGGAHRENLGVQEKLVKARALRGGQVRTCGALKENNLKLSRKLPSVFSQAWKAPVGFGF